MEKPNYFKEWGDACPVTVLIAITLVGTGVLAGFIGVLAGLVFEITRMAEPGDQSMRWAFYVMGLAMIVLVPVGLNRVLASYYRREMGEEIAAGLIEAYESGKAAAAAEVAAAAATRR